MKPEELHVEANLEAEDESKDSAPSRAESKDGVGDGAESSKQDDDARDDRAESAQDVDRAESAQGSDGEDVRTILILHASVGSGHKVAAEAIGRAFEIFNEENDEDCAEGDEEACGKPRYKAEVLDILDFGRIVFNGDNTASMFTGAGRPIYDLTWRYTFTGRLLWGGGTVWARIKYPKFVEYVRKVKPSAIVATHIVGANVAVSARMLTGQEFPIVCVPTDYEVEGLWPHKYTDLFCVANQHMEETLRARKVPESRMKITGIPVSPGFSKTYEKHEGREMYGLPEDKKIVLFQAGATLPRPYIHFRSAIDQLLPYMHTFTDMHFVVVAGKDKEYAEHMRREVKERGLTNVTVLGYVDKMAHLMAASDLIVCKSGGLTVTEGLCVGTPMILMGRAYGQEKANVLMLTATGSAFHVTTARELGDLLRKIDEHPEIAESVRTNAGIIKKPSAAFDIAAATIELIDEEKDPLNELYRRHFVHFYWGKRPAHIR